MKDSLWAGKKKYMVICQLNDILEWYCYNHKCSNHVCMNCSHNDRVDRCEESCCDCPFAVETIKPLCALKSLCGEAYKDKPDAKKNDLAKLILDIPAFKEVLYSLGYDNITQEYYDCMQMALRVKEITTIAFFKVYYNNPEIRSREMDNYYIQRFDNITFEDLLL